MKWFFTHNFCRCKNKQFAILWSSPLLTNVQQVIFIKLAICRITGNNKKIWSMDLIARCGLYSDILLAIQNVKKKQHFCKRNTYLILLVNVLNWKVQTGLLSNGIFFVYWTYAFTTIHLVLVSAPVLLYWFVCFFTFAIQKIFNVS